MKEIAVTLTADMVKAILSGNKRQHRRIMENQPNWVKSGNPMVASGYSYHDPKGKFELNSFPYIDSFKCALFNNIDKKYGDIGDHLYIRETFAYVPTTAYMHSHSVQKKICPNDPEKCVIYKADFPLSQSGIKWLSPTQMPKWASRISLKIKEIGLEPLQEITEDDAIDEGMTFTDYGNNQFGYQKNGWCWKETKSSDECLMTARAAFANQWNKIHGKNQFDDTPWYQNPWVWFFVFERVKPISERIQYLKERYPDLDIYICDDPMMITNDEPEFWSINNNNAIRFEPEISGWLSSMLSGAWVKDACRKVK